MRKGKSDDNQSEIVAALRKVGAKVKVLSTYPKQLDLLVGFRKKLFWLEVKDGNKSPSQRKLTDEEIIIFKEWSEFVNSGSIGVVENVQEALTFIGALDAQA